MINATFFEVFAYNFEAGSAANAENPAALFEKESVLSKANAIFSLLVIFIACLA